MPIERVTNIYSGDLGLDEVVATRCYVHLARMDDNNKFWMCIEADGRRIDVWLSAHGAIRAYVEENGRPSFPTAQGGETSRSGAQ